MSSLPFVEMLLAAQARNQSMLCVGLDPDPSKFPVAWPRQAAGILSFCKRIVEATADQVIAFKPQIAYFAANRAELELELLVKFIREAAPGVPVILDSKRGDIGSTAEQYAREAFERYGADAVTLSPFMGFDSIQPYLEYKGKGAFLLCRTSNQGGADFQNLQMFDQQCGGAGALLYEHIAKQVNGKWNTGGQLGLVVGATFPHELARVREIAPRLPLLVPGIGAQGGDVVATVNAAWRPDAPIVVNSSRAILYASPGEDFAQAARKAATKTRRMLERAKPKS